MRKECSRRQFLALGSTLLLAGCSGESDADAVETEDSDATPEDTNFSVNLQNISMEKSGPSKREVTVSGSITNEGDEVAESVFVDLEIYVTEFDSAIYTKTSTIHQDMKEIGDIEAGKTKPVTFNFDVGTSDGVSAVLGDCNFKYEAIIDSLRTEETHQGEYSFTCDF